MDLATSLPEFNPGKFPLFCSPNYLVEGRIAHISEEKYLFKSFACQTPSLARSIAKAEIS
jgi:hypothetical protein